MPTRGGGVKVEHCVHIAGAAPQMRGIVHHSTRRLSTGSRLLAHGLRPLCLSSSVTIIVN